MENEAVRNNAEVIEEGKLEQQEKQILQ